ncbi:hypothetical protein Tco_0247952 [Tanacetum coccineum]
MSRAQTGLRRKQSSKHTSESKTEANKGGSSTSPTRFKTGHLAQETQSSLAVDTNPNQPSASIPLVAEIHKEDQQVAGGLTSFGATRCDASADSTAEVDPGISAPNDYIPQQ